LHGKEVLNSEVESQAKVFVTRVHALPAVRPAARLPAQVSSVSHLLSRTGASGTDSRRGEIELVRKALPIFDCRFPIGNSIGNRQLAIENGVLDD